MHGDRLAEDHARRDRRLDEFDVRQEVEHGIERGPRLHACELGAEAGVRALGERDVGAPVRTVDPELVGRVEHGRVAVGRGQRDDHQVATAKASDQLVVYDGDSGQRLRTVAGPGAELGQLSRPNGIATIDDRFAFVVERDNHRVQMFSLPDFTPLLAFGQEQLQQPYGLWVRPLDDGYEVLVSDAYMAGEDAQGDDIVPPLEQLDRRFQRYQVRQAADQWSATASGAFGDTSAAGAIRVPESLFGDVDNNRLLVAEEDVPTGTRLREYDLQGKYLGRDVGTGNYVAQAEGIALLRCADGSGWWLASDQFADRTVFHLFERRSLEHVGSFAGEATGLTDGVWLDPRGDARFPQGAFYASHLDQGVAAFDWRDIATALELPACPR